MRIRPQVGEANTTAIILGALLAAALGVIAGMYLGRGEDRAEAATDNPVHDHAAHQPALSILSPEELAVIEGFTCNCQEPGCDFLPLTTCTCDTARAMHTLVKRLIAQGKTREQIGQELESIWGDGVYPDGSAAGTSTP